MLDSLRFSPIVRLGAGLLAASACLFGSSGLASAHASLMHANISADQVFAHNAYPRTLTAFFTENIKPSASWVHVFEGDPSGDHGRVDGGKLGFPFTHPKEITTTLPAGLKGRYTLMWFTTSEDDGHVAGNAYTFTVK